MKLEYICDISERSLSTRLRNTNDWIIEIKLSINLRGNNYILGAYLWRCEERNRLTSYVLVDLAIIILDV